MQRRSPGFKVRCSDRVGQLKAAICPMVDSSTGVSGKWVKDFAPGRPLRHQAYKVPGMQPLQVARDSCIYKQPPRPGPGRKSRSLRKCGEVSAMRSSRQQVASRMQSSTQGQQLLAIRLGSRGLHGCWALPSVETRKNSAWRESRTPRRFIHNDFVVEITSLKASW